MTLEILKIGENIITDQKLSEMFKAYENGGYAELKNNETFSKMSPESQKRLYTGIKSSGYGAGADLLRLGSQNPYTGAPVLRPNRISVSEFTPKSPGTGEKQAKVEVFNAPPPPTKTVNYNNHVNTKVQQGRSSDTAAAKDNPRNR